MTHKEKISFLIEFFIKKPTPQWENFRAKQEFIAASKLLKLYPDIEFFTESPDLKEKFNSLFGILKKENISKLNIKYKDYINSKNNKPKQYELSTQPLIDIKIQNSNPKNILDFLKT